MSRKVSDLSGKPIGQADHVRIDARFGDGRRGMTCDLTVKEFEKLLPFARPLRPYGGTCRGYEAGPEGVEILVIGAPSLGDAPRDDLNGERDWWAHDVP